MNFKKSLLTISLAVTGLVTAQENTFSLEGEFRPRTEWFGHGGPFTNAVNPNPQGKAFAAETALKGTEGFVSTSVRAALKATYTAKNYTLFTSFQEVFLLGDRTQTAIPSNGNLRVQEAWADIKLAENLTFKIGRQELSYDDQRILGGLGWAQQARTHDAGVFKYTKEGYNLDLGFALNTNAGTGAVYNSADLFSYRDMAFVRANKAYGDFTISVLGLANTFQNGATTNPQDKSTLITAGTHLGYKVGDLTLAANAFIQDGYRVGDAPVENAYLGSLDATYKFSDKLTALAGFETISGKTDDSAAFFPLYGTNHKFNGLMDRFYVANHANAGGLNDINAGIKTSLAGVAVTLKGHLFTEVEDVNNDGEDALGSEIDLVLAKQFDGFKLVGGYSQFFEPDTAPANAKDTQNWAWIMLIIKPKFL